MHKKKVNKLGLRKLLFFPIIHRALKVGESRFLGSSEIPYPVKRFPNSALYFEQIPYPVRRFPNFGQISCPGINLSHGEPFFCTFSSGELV